MMIPRLNKLFVCAFVLMAVSVLFIGMVLSGAASVDAVTTSGANGAGASGAASACPDGEGVRGSDSADSQGDEAAGDYVAGLLSSPQPPALGAWSAADVAKLIDGEAGGERAEKAPDGLSDSDWAGIRKAHEAWQYSVQPLDEGGHTARNPGQQWLTRFDGRAFLVHPDDAAWRWGLELTAYGFPGHERALPSPVDADATQVEAGGSRLSYARDGNVREWFVNDGRGLEHGFVINERPEGSDAAQAADGKQQLTLRMAVRGTLRAVVERDGAGVRFVDAGGAPIVNYTGLKVWDTDGRELAARFERDDAHHVTLAVDERGARYPVTIDPIAQQAYLKPNPLAVQSGDQFGSSVAVSGDTVVVGAHLEDSSTTGVNSTPNESASGAGAAYVFVRNGAAWSQQAYLKPAAVGTTQADDNFGISVAVSGETVIVGAHMEDSSTTGINSTPNESAGNGGAAYVFVRNGTTWSQQAYLKPAAVGTSQEGDQFGWSVAVSGDTVVVGAVAEDSSTTGINSTSDESATDAGAAYVFVRSETAWSQQAYLKPAAIGTTQAGDRLGYSVAVSGDTVVVGALLEASSTTGVNSTPNESAPGAGAAYVFSRSGAAWSQQAYLKPAAVGTTQANDVFGRSVAVSGDTVVVGAVAEDSSTTGINSMPNESATDAGAAYVFVRSGTAWSQQAYLKPAAVGTTQAGDQFGRSVAVSGDTVVVGASGEDSSTTGINSTPNESAGSAGAAYVFVRNGAAWSQQAYLKPAAVGTTQASDLFGYSVAVSGDTVVVGALLEASSMTGVNSTPDESAPGAGAAYVFTGLGFPTNTAPAASPNTVQTNEDTSVGITLTGTDADDNNLTFIITAQPTRGTLSAVSSPDCTAVNTCTATLTYTPDLNYNGADSFKFKVNDGTIDSADATISITVNAIARLSVNDVSQNETNSGTTNFNFTVTLSAASSQTVTVNYATANGTATAPADYTAIGATTLTFNPGETSKQVAVSVVGDTTVELNETFFVNLSNPTNATISDNQGQGIIVNDDSAPTPKTFTFSSTNYNAGEADARATVFVIRAGDTSAGATVDYRTQDTDTFTVGCADAVNNQGGAYARCDFATVAGRLDFAAGETQKTITIPVIDDGHIEGAETFQIVLTSPVGAGLDTSATAVITIQDNDTAGASNPVISSKEFFVRQQYLDFLSREPDTDGLNAWLGVLNNCQNIFTGPNVASGCDRIFVSGEGFFRSGEFQLKGFYVFRFYKVAFNRLPEYLEVVADMSFVAGQTAEEVYARKAQVATSFTERQEFNTLYGGMNNAQYVSALLGRYQLTQVTTPDPAQPDTGAKVTLSGADMENRLNTGALTRAQVLRAVADSDAVGAQEFNNAFVGMQYYGYLRRKPDQAGFNAWLAVLQSGNVRTMVDGFLNSVEYKLRFGQP